MVIILMLTNAISIANSKGVKNELMKMACSYYNHSLWSTQVFRALLTSTVESGFLGKEIIF